MMTKISPAFHVQVAIIGAGVLGLACARSLARRGKKEVYIFERASTICSETSSRNSEVIHAGIYYPPTSLKAKFCTEGKNQLYEYIEQRNIPYEKCGKLIVATEKEQLKNELPALKDRAEKNGVDDLRILSKEDVKILEPEVECYGALLSPSTGVIDSHSFFLSLLADAEQQQQQQQQQQQLYEDDGTASGGGGGGCAHLVLNSPINDAKIDENNNNDGSSRLCLQVDDTWISCDNVINCAGLYASEVASMIHKKHNNNNNESNIKWTPPDYYFAKGTYFRYQGLSPFQHLIYPVPVQGGLGIHATIDYNRTSLKFGPDVEWMDYETTVPSQITYKPDEKRGKMFYEQVQKYWPNVQESKLVPDYVGVRPKLSHPSTTTTTAAATMNGKIKNVFDDFRIDGPESHGIDGLVHLFGIESPGLTSSLAIADHVTNIITRTESG